MIAKKLVPRFEIFIEHVNGIKESAVEEPIVEELVQTTEQEKDIPTAELKDVVDQEGECDFEFLSLSLS